MEYVKVAETTSLPAGKMMAINAGGHEILLANVDGTYYAIGNKCTHQGNLLSNGTLDGNVVTCLKHGGKFDVKTGQSVAGAKLGIIKIKLRDEMHYDVKIEGTDILIGLW